MNSPAEECTAYISTIYCPQPSHIGWCGRRNIVIHPSCHCVVVFLTHHWGLCRNHYPGCKIIRTSTVFVLEQVGSVPCYQIESTRGLMTTKCRLRFRRDPTTDLNVRSCHAGGITSRTFPMRSTLATTSDTGSDENNALKFCSTTHVHQPPSYNTHVEPMMPHPRLCQPWSSFPSLRLSLPFHPRA
jgi:hypothetical protein